MTIAEVPRSARDATTSRPGPGVSRPPVDTAQAKRGIPALWWAFIGTLVVALIAYDWIDWLADGDARENTTGRNLMPHWMKIADYAQEAAVICFLIAAVYFYLYKPWRREGRISLDGILIIGWTSMYMLQDPWENYTSISYSYNTGFFNLGCPQCHVPGWLSPGAHGAHQFPEPLIFIGLMYGGVLFLGTVAICWAMRRAKRRWPAMTTAKLIAFGLFSGFLIDWLLEIPAMRMGGWMWWWAGPKDLTLFSGKFYQQPLLEPIFWGLTWGGAACFRYFTNDKGQTIAERGVERLKVGNKTRTGVRMLAVIGVLNLIMLFGYTLPYQFFGTHARATPASICKEPYFTGGMAGAGSAVGSPYNVDGKATCPGPTVPIPRDDGGA